MAQIYRSDKERLNKMLSEQASSLQSGVHFHPFPSPKVGEMQHGMTGSESPLNRKLLQRPASALSTEPYKTHLVGSANSSPRSLLPELRARGLQEESRKAAAEGKANWQSITQQPSQGAQLAYASQKNNNNVNDVNDASTPYRSHQGGGAHSSSSSSSSRPHTASATSSIPSSTPRRLFQEQQQQQQQQQQKSGGGDHTSSPHAISMTPRPPAMQRQDLPVAGNLPSTTRDAMNPPRHSAEAMDEVACKNPFYVAHAPPAMDSRTGEPKEQEQEQGGGGSVNANSAASAAAAGGGGGSSSSPATSSRPTSGHYRYSEALSTSKAAEYHESQREVLNLQLRGVADHALKMRKATLEAVGQPVKDLVNEGVDLANGCTAALKSYEENYDCCYEVKAPEIVALAEQVKVKTSLSELRRLLDLPNIDPQSVRAALAELSAPVEEDPREDALRVLSASRLDLCKRNIGKLDGVAELTVADSILRMYEILHTDVLSAPRDLLSADENALNAMQRDIESLYIKRSQLLDDVQHNTNRIVPLMADGPLSGAGGESSRPTSASFMSSSSPSHAASKEISNMMSQEEDESIKREVLESSPSSRGGRPGSSGLRVHTVQALSPPKNSSSSSSTSRVVDGGVAQELVPYSSSSSSSSPSAAAAAAGSGSGGNSLAVVPEDTEEDMDGRKLSVVEQTQRREVTVSRELLTRRTNRCNAMLDFVDGVRAFVAEAMEQQALGREITAKNRLYLERVIATAGDDMTRIQSAVREEKAADAEAVQNFMEEQRKAHTDLANMAAEEGQIWEQVQKLVEKANSISVERDALFLHRMRETELEQRRLKQHRLKLDRLAQINIMLQRTKRHLSKYEEAAKDCEAYHNNFVAEALLPKLEQEQELITLRGAEALAFAQSFKNFVFSAEDLLARLEVRGTALKQRQRSAAMDESVAEDSLDIAGRDSYLTEMRRLSQMIHDTEKKTAEITGWIREGREAAREFMPIAHAARDAARKTKPRATSAAQMRAAKLADSIQESTFEAAIDARKAALDQVDGAENVMAKQKQSAEEQVEELRSDIRRQKRENEALMRQQVMAVTTPNPNSRKY